MLSKVMIICMVFGTICSAPMEKTGGCLNDERFIETNEASWTNRCGTRDENSSPSFNAVQKQKHYKNLAYKIKLIHEHTLEYGSGDLEEYHKWHNQFEFLPKISDANTEEDYHRHLQIFVATFQFLQKVQYRYHIQTFPQLFIALEHQALRVLCTMENNLDIAWKENHMLKEEMNEKMCKFNLGIINEENQNFRNTRFTQMLFRQYLEELHKIIQSLVV